MRIYRLRTEVDYLEVPDGCEDPVGYAEDRLDGDDWVEHHDDLQLYRGVPIVHVEAQA